MDETRHSRTELLVGTEGLQRLAAAHVAVFGIGGVGSYAAEAIARAGIGVITLVDFDTVAPSNINRQLIALESTLGLAKVDVARQRIHEINPEARVTAVCERADARLVDRVLDSGAGFVIDAIDHIQDKVALIAAAFRRGVPLVSCMGAANKVSPLGILVTDISKTRDCPLARAVRQRLRKAGIDSGIRCVYSHENRRTVRTVASGEAITKRRVQGSISYVPGIVGLTAAGLIVCDILSAPGEAPADQT